MNDTTKTPLRIHSDPAIVAALREQQQRIEQSTGIRASLSQIAESILRRGLAAADTAKT